MQSQPSFFKHLLGSFAVASLSVNSAIDTRLGLTAANAHSKGMYSDYFQTRVFQETRNLGRAMNPREAIKADVSLGALAAVPLSVLSYGVSRLTGYYKDSNKSAATVAIIQEAIRRESTKASPRKSHRSTRRRRR